jgi:hypothetical protein
MHFRQRLIDAADQWPVEDSRLIRLINNPRTPHPLIAHFALSTFIGASHFAQAIALMFCQASHPAAKAFLFENLIEETGLVLRDRTVRYRPLQEHTAWARRFCHACQLNDAQLDAALKSAPRWPARAFALLEQHDWQAAIAYLVVGYERASPRYMQAAYNALLSRGFNKEDVAFFHNHIEADQMHGEAGVDILASLAQSPADEERLLQWVTEGAGDFWQGLNGNNHGRV